MAYHILFMDFFISSVLLFNFLVLFASEFPLNISSQQFLCFCLVVFRCFIVSEKKKGKTGSEYLFTYLPLVPYLGFAVCNWPLLVFTLLIFLFAILKFYIL